MNQPYVGNEQECPQSVDVAYKKMLKKKNPAQLKKMSQKQELDGSLSKYDIMRITSKAFKQQKNKRPKPEIFTTIKGRPYCLKLGEIDPTVDNFKGFYDTFYTNLYRADITNENRPHLPSRYLMSAKTNTSDKQNLRQKSQMSSLTKDTRLSLDSRSSNRKILQENFTNFINDCSQVLQTGCKRRSLVKYPTMNPFCKRF